MGILMRTRALAANEPYRRVEIPRYDAADATINIFPNVYSVETSLISVTISRDEDIW